MIVSHVLLSKLCASLCYYKTSTCSSPWDPQVLPEPNLNPGPMNLPSDPSLLLAGHENQLQTARTPEAFSFSLAKTAEIIHCPRNQCMVVRLRPRRIRLYRHHIYSPRLHTLPWSILSWLCYLWDRLLTRVIISHWPNP